MGASGLVVVFASMPTDPKQRTEPPPLKLRTREEAENALAIVASTTAQRDAELAEQNRKLVLARAHDAKIRECEDRLLRYRSALQDWCNNNRAKEFHGEQTLEMRHGWLRFRWTQRKVVFLEGWDEDRTVARMIELKELVPYVRMVPQLDKARLLIDTREPEGTLAPRDLKRVGLEIKQEEKFSVEPNLDCVTP